jgi:hypothetical protein
MTTLLRNTLGVVGLVAAAGAQAQAAPDGLNWRLGLSVEHSDNMARRPVAVSETVIEPTLAFAYLKEGSRGELEAAGSASYRRYQQGRFDNETLQQIGLTGRWVLAPERLSWALQSVITDQPVNPFGVDAPDNRQRTQVLVTGPTLAVRPSTNVRLLGELRFMDTGAERTPEFDGQRAAAAARLLYQRSPVSALSAEFESIDAEFDRAGAAPDYRRDNAFLRYSRLGARGDWNADIGYSQVRFDDTFAGFSREESLPMARLRVAHALTDITRLEIDLQRGFGDSVEDLLDGAPRADDYALPIGRTAIRDTTLSSDLFEQTGGRLGLSHRSEATYFRIDGRWRRQEYLRATGLDQTIRGFVVSANRQVRATFSLGAQAGVEWRRFGAIERRDRDSRIALVANWRTSRRTGLSFELSHGERSSTEAQQVFDDNRALVTFNLVR